MNLLAQLAPPSGSDFAVFLGCVVAILAIVALVLTVISQGKSLFFAKPHNDEFVTRKELTDAVSELEMKIDRRSLELETKIDTFNRNLVDTVNKLNDYVHKSTHDANNTMNSIGLKVERLLVLSEFSSPKRPVPGVSPP